MSATPIPSMDEQEAKRRAEWLHRNNAPFDWVVLTIEEVAKLRADLARVTAELEHHKSVKETIDSAHKELSREHAALRARVESATPAKHPDTVRLDWLEEAPSERLADVRRIIWQQRDTCEATRAAIDAARKHEASK